jgi:L-lysine exporter family protein LysE/ArgO
VFVLQQGLQRRHVALVVVVCALSDVVLILLGIGGLSLVIRRAPVAVEVARWAGAAFLISYGVLAARRAALGNDAIRLEREATRGAGTVLATCLAFTWLNPHVYLDTVLLLGSIANTHGPTGRWWFGAGASLGSVVWFTALGLGARLLTPLFRRPAAWRVLDTGVALVMFTVAALLLLAPGA